jgi:hypothetical protein
VTDSEEKVLIIDRLETDDLTYELGVERPKPAFHSLSGRIAVSAPRNSDADSSRRQPLSLGTT